MQRLILFSLIKKRLLTNPKTNYRRRQLLLKAKSQEFNVLMFISEDDFQTEQELHLRV